MAGNKTLSQIYAANPITTIGNTDLVYVSSGNSDAAIDGADMIAQFSALAQGVSSVALSAPAIFTVGGSPVTSTGALALSLATQTANRVWAGPTTGSAATPTFRALVADDVPALDSGLNGILPAENGGTGSEYAPEIYLLMAHSNNTEKNKLRCATSADGVTWKSMGPELPWVPAVGGVRDPSFWYHEGTRQWVVSFTKAGIPGTFPTTDSSYDNKLGLATTKDFKTFTELTSITITGVTPTLDIVWNGSFFEDGGNLYLSLLPQPYPASQITPGPGWIQIQNPTADPSAWTYSAFTPMIANNANWSTLTAANDLHVTKIGSTYRLFMDCTIGGVHGIYASTSSSPFTGYSTPALVSGHTNREGAILAPQSDGGWILYSEPVFGAMGYSLTDDFVTYSAPAEINWFETMFLGNGDVKLLTNPDQIAPAVNAQRVLFSTPDGSAIGQSILNFPSTQLAIYGNTPTSGNGGTGSRFSVLTASSGGLNTNLTLYMTQGAYVYSSLGFADDSARNATRSNMLLYIGTGSPEGSQTAVIGSIYSRTDGGAGTCLYVKESGTGNTGWVAK